MVGSMNTEAGMQLGTAPLLERYQVFRSHDADETRAFLSGKGYQFDLSPRQARQLNTRLNAVYMRSMYLSYLHYGDLPVELAPGLARSDFLVQLPVRGHLAASVGCESVDSNPSRAVIVSPVHGRCRFVSSADSTRLQLALGQAALSEQLAALLGEPPKTPLDFAPVMDLTRSYGRSLAQHVLMAAASLDEAGSVLLHPMTMDAFEQFVMTALLLSHPHNYSNALQRLEKAITPRDVRRAIDYIEAHLDQAITVADLVEATGVAGRTLFIHFKNFKGISPVRYARNARLRKVRQALLRAEAGASVTDIAMNCGFTHMGRFSVTYRRCFGESPSQTLKRSRQVRPPCG
jgi:AraC-like DNA-binding protein